MTAHGVHKIDTIAATPQKLVLYSGQSDRLLKWHNFQKIVHETYHKSQKKLLRWPCGPKCRGCRKPRDRERSFILDMILEVDYRLHFKSQAVWGRQKQLF